MDEKPYRYENLPIPTYEEATSSRPTSSRSRVGPEETSDDAERQGLLLGRGDGDQGGNSSTRHTNYEAPTVESERSSFESLDGLDNDHEAAEVRREMQEMDIEEPDGDNGSHRSLLTYRFKRFTSFTNSLTSLSLPSFRRFIPSISLPCSNIDWQSVDTNRIVILGRLFGVFLIIGVLYVLIATDILNLTKARLGPPKMFQPEDIRNFIQDQYAEWHHMKMHYEHITQFPHMAGTEGSYRLGEWIQELFKTHELENVGQERYDVYMNYPRPDGRRLAIVDPEDLKWEATLSEPDEETPVFHGYSQAGEVKGPLVYANFGSQDDFQKLEEQGISVKGAIILMRQHGLLEDQGTKVKAAQDLGAAGCIIYADPAQTPADARERAMPAAGISRAGVGLMSYVMGDPLSPGWSSTVSFRDRLHVGETKGLVTIPSLPISWNDASHLLKVLQGHGKKMEDAWAGLPGTEYWTGDVTSSPKLVLKNLQDEEFYQPIYNFVGRIAGWEAPNKKIVIGSHRDAWCLGASSPGSGTAILLAMTRAFGTLKRQGWQPLRTIEFVSWDAGEFNAAGSTEHVENREIELRDDAVAYLNLGFGVTGTEFSVSASPLYSRMLEHALKRVGDPLRNTSVFEAWTDNGSKMPEIGVRGDATPFQHITGTPSIDVSFKGPTPPIGSCYDNLNWMSTYGDGGGEYEYSSALAQILSLIVLELSDAPLLPLDIRSYTHQLSVNFVALEEEFKTRKVPEDIIPQLDPIRESIGILESQAGRITGFDDHWRNMIMAAGGFEAGPLTVHRLDRNNRVGNFEAKFLNLPKPDKNGATGAAVGNPGGVPERSQYKHAVYAPQVTNPDLVDVFPGIRYYLRLEDWDGVKNEMVRLKELIDDAAQELSIS